MKAAVLPITFGVWLNHSQVDLELGSRESAYSSFGADNEAASLLLAGLYTVSFYPFRFESSLSKELQTGGKICENFESESSTSYRRVQPGHYSLA